MVLSYAKREAFAEDRTLFATFKVLPLLKPQPVTLALTRTRARALTLTPTLTLP
jgi:hypothetical protein